MDFGKRLRELLPDRCLTQKEFADALHIDASTVGNYVRGEREPDYDTLKNMAAYFGVSTDFLLCVQLNNTVDECESELIQIYRTLNPDRKDLLLEQAKLLLRKNR